MLNNGTGGIDCIECGHMHVCTSREDLEALKDSLTWVGGDPVCPECGDSLVFEDYIGGE